MVITNNIPDKLKAGLTTAKGSQKETSSHSSRNRSDRKTSSGSSGKSSSPRTRSEIEVGADGAPQRFVLRNPWDDEVVHIEYGPEIKAAKEFYHRHVILGYNIGQTEPETEIQLNYEQEHSSSLPPRTLPKPQQRQIHGSQLIDDDESGELMASQPSIAPSSNTHTSTPPSIPLPAITPDKEAPPLPQKNAAQLEQQRRQQQQQQQQQQSSSKKRTSPGLSTDFANEMISFFESSFSPEASEAGDGSDSGKNSTGSRNLVDNVASAVSSPSRANNAPAVAPKPANMRAAQKQASSENNHESKEQEIDFSALCSPSSRLVAQKNNTIASPIAAHQLSNGKIEHIKTGSSSSINRSNPPTAPLPQIDLKKDESLKAIKKQPIAVPQDVEPEQNEEDVEIADTPQVDTAPLDVTQQLKNDSKALYSPNESVHSVLSQGTYSSGVTSPDSPGLNNGPRRGSTSSRYTHQGNAAASGSLLSQNRLPLADATRRPSIANSMRSGRFSHARNGSNIFSEGGDASYSPSVASSFSNNDKSMLMNEIANVESFFADLKIDKPMPQLNAGKGN